MDIKQLKYFCTIAEEKQITGAAKRLHMAQPPLSYQLKTLEDELNVKLIERGSRKIKLTDAGIMLYKKAKQILNLTQETFDELKNFSEGIYGTLSIGTISSSGYALVTERLIDFSHKYPHVNFEIFEGNTYDVLEMLNRGVIEIGIVRTPFNDSNVNKIYLSKEPMVAAMDRQLDWDTNVKSVSIAELKDKPVIFYRRFEKLIYRSCEHYGFEPNIFCKNDDARTTLLWASTGLGIAIVPKSSLKLNNSSNLIYKEINEETLTTQIAVIWAKNSYISTAAKHFLNIFTD